MKPAIFFDRDGTLNEEIGYAKDPARIRLLPGAPEAVAIARQAGFLTVIISNQSGIARGLMSEDQAQSVNRRVVELLLAFGSTIDGVYYCPHHPQGKVEKFSIACACRKPQPGLLQQAASELGINLKESFVIGDKASDVESAAAAGAMGILVRTGYGNDQADEILRLRIKVAHTADGVQQAVEWIVMKQQDLSHNH